MNTKALRKLPPHIRDEVKSIMDDLIKNDGMTQKEAGREAVQIILDESLTSRDELIKKMSK